MAYRLTKKTTEASYPRAHCSSTISPTDKLLLSYNLFESTQEYAEDKVVLNLFFSQPAGCTKEVWNFHIEKLYEYDSAHKDKAWRINKIVAYDSTAQGDSALANKGKLGISNVWTDSGLDVIKVACVDEQMHLSGKLILIGHSYGAFSLIVAAWLKPGLFDSVISVEPPIVDLEKPLERTFSPNFAAKIFQMSKSDFKSWDQAKHFHYKLSFFKNVHPRIRQDIFVNDYYQDPSTGRILKKSNYQYTRMMYTGFRLASEMFFKNLKTVRVPVASVSGTATNWLSNEELKDLDCQFNNPNYIGSGPEAAINGVYHIDGVGHMGCFEKPQRFFEIILSHINIRANACSDNKKLSKLDYSERQREKVFENWDKTFMDGAYSDPHFDPKPKL